MQKRKTTRKKSTKSKPKAKATSNVRQKATQAQNVRVNIGNRIFDRYTGRLPQGVLGRLPLQNAASLKIPTPSVFAPSAASSNPLAIQQDYYNRLRKLEKESDLLKRQQMMRQSSEEIKQNRIRSELEKYMNIASGMGWSPAAVQYGSELVSKRGLTADQAARSVGISFRLDNGGRTGTNWRRRRQGAFGTRAVNPDMLASSSSDSYDVRTPTPIARLNLDQFSRYINESESGREHSGVETEGALSEAERVKANAKAEAERMRDQRLKAENTRRAEVLQGLSSGDAPSSAGAPLPTLRSQILAQGPGILDTQLLAQRLAQARGTTTPVESPPKSSESKDSGSEPDVGRSLASDIAALGISEPKPDEEDE